MKKIIILTILAGMFLLSFLSAAAQEHSGDAKALNEETYCSEVLKAIKNAKESIDIAMFLMVLEEKGNRFRKLIDELAAAHERGLRVRVVLDKRGDVLNETQKAELEMFRSTDNESTYNYLESRGVDVKFDLPDNPLGASVVVIDGRITISGSMYWAEPITDVSETCFLIESEGLAENMISFIDDIETE